MNVHPLFVHFPIALLTLYALLEILPLARWFPRVPWDPIKMLLVVLGTLGAITAIATGSIAEHLITNRSLRPVIHLHQTFAGLTTIIFGFLATTYIIRFVFREYPQLVDRFSSLSFLRTIGDSVLKRWIAIPLALMGIITITITSALGGIIVYGPDVDPIAKFAYSLFF